MPSASQTHIDKSSLNLARPQRLIQSRVAVIAIGVLNIVLFHLAMGWLAYFLLYQA